MEPSNRYRDGSVGHLLEGLHGGFLLGLTVRHDSHIVTIDEIVIEPRGDRPGSRTSWRLRVDDEPRDIGYDISPFAWVSITLCFPLDPGAQPRCVDVLRRRLETTPLSLDDGLIEEIVLALLHEPTPDTFAGWVAANGLLFLSENGVLARVERGDSSVELKAEALTLEPRTASVKLEVSIARREATELQDMIVQETYVGSIDPDVFLAPASHLGDPRFSDLITKWRGALRSSLERTAWLNDDLPMPHHVLEETDGLNSIFSLMGSWILDGFPPPKPRTRPPAKARISGQATRIRRLDKAALTDLPRGLSDVHTGYEIEGWSLLLAPGLKGAKLGADRILLRENKATPIVLLRSDDEPQQRLKYTIDGDAQAMRTLLRWLRELIRAASLDGHFEFVWPFGQPKERRSISEWLTFGWKDHPFDWRCSRDLIVDQTPYWDWDSDDSYLPSLSPAKQARILDVEIPTYHRFYRAVVDPSFVGKADGLLVI